MTNELTGFNPIAIFDELLDEHISEPAQLSLPINEPHEDDGWASIGDGCYIRSTSYKE